MAVLVTGGAGFIGSHTVDLLLKKGIKTIILDDLSTGKKEYINKKAIFFKGSICDSDLLKKIFSENEIGKVCHFAAQTRIEQSMKNPIKDAETNILGTLKLLEASANAKIEKFVFASSAAVYGFTDKTAVKETSPKNPFSPYGISKLACEQYIEFYAKRNGFNYCNLRYGNVFGPRQNTQYGGVIAKFTQKMLKGKPPEIFGSGEQTRDFIFVEDAVRATVLALESDKSGNFNISGSKQTSVNEIFKMLSKLTEFNQTPVFRPTREEVKFNQLDCSKAYNELGWKTKVQLEKGLQKTVQFMRSLP